MSEIKIEGGIGFTGILTLVFITLKLTNFISWSWWWVLSPLWIPITIILTVVMVLICGIVLLEIFGSSE